MIDYVSRNDVVEALYDLCNRDQTQEFTMKELYAIRAVPAADVRPVVRGYWVHDDNGWASCSVCAHEADSDKWEMDVRGKNRPAETHFCPNCGADMRKITGKQEATS